MRLRLLHRTFSAVCGLWLALSLAEPASLHVCLAHDSQPSAHSHGTVHLAHGPHAPASHHGAAPCTCLGGCCLSVAVPAVTAAPLVAAFLADMRLPRVLVPVAFAYRPAAVAYARPPSVGPPLHTA